MRRYLHCWGSSLVSSETRVASVCLFFLKGVEKDKGCGFWIEAGTPKANIRSLQMVILGSKGSGVPCEETLCWFWIFRLFNLGLRMCGLVSEVLSCQSQVCWRCDIPHNNLCTIHIMQGLHFHLILLFWRKDVGWYGSHACRGIQVCQPKALLLVAPLLCLCRSYTHEGLQEGWLRANEVSWKPVLIGGTTDGAWVWGPAKLNTAC